MDEVYEDFKAHVVQARGDRLKKPIDELAGGRVFTGKQAWELGLVDKLGTLDDAIKFAAAEAGLTDDYDIRVIPRPKNFVELMFKEMAGKSEDDDRLSLGLARPGHPQSAWEAVLPLLERLEPQRATALRSALIQLEVLQRESLTLTTPSYLWTN
jgi:protease-4